MWNWFFLCLFLLFLQMARDTDGLLGREKEKERELNAEKEEIKERAGTWSVKLHRVQWLSSSLVLDIE